MPFIQPNKIPIKFDDLIFYPHKRLYILGAMSCMFHYGNEHTMSIIDYNDSGEIGEMQLMAMTSGGYEMYSTAWYEPITNIQTKRQVEDLIAVELEFTGCRRLFVEKKRLLTSPAIEMLATYMSDDFQERCN